MTREATPGDDLVHIFRQRAKHTPGESPFERVRLRQLKRGDWFLRLQDGVLQHSFAMGEAYVDKETGCWTIEASPAKIPDNREET